MSDKIEARVRLLRERSTLNNKSLNSISLAIFSNLLLVDPFVKAETLHCFLSSTEKKEINTQPIIDWLKQNRKKVVVPRVDDDRTSLSHIELGSEEGFKKNIWGIQEPIGGQMVDINDLDVVLVPMIAADRQKNRLGYGKGFYDRFLSNTDICKIGLLANQFLLEEPLPVDEYDVPMDIIVTDREIFY